MKLPNLAKATGLGAAAVLMTAGIASAAVATTTVNVRTGPGVGYNAIDTLSRGEQVAIVDRDGNWCAVQKSGPDGWVSCAYLSNGVIIRQPSVRVSPSVSFWPSVATSSRFGLRQVARVPSSSVQSASDMMTFALKRSCRYDAPPT